MSYIRENAVIFWLFFDVAKSPQLFLNDELFPNSKLLKYHKINLFLYRPALIEIFQSYFSFSIVTTPTPCQLTI